MKDTIDRRECHVNSEDVRTYKEQYAEQMMHEHCKEHNISCPNHIIKDAFRIAFMHGFEYACQKYNIE